MSRLTAPTGLSHRYGASSSASSEPPTTTLGRTPSPSLHPYAEAAAHRSAEDLESQNDEQIDGLRAKVQMLKNVTIGIRDEVRESATQLSQMNDAFAETGGILSGTFRRMNNMAERQGCRFLWYIVFLTIVFWFFIVMWWFRR